MRYAEWLALRESGIEKVPRFADLAKAARGIADMIDANVLPQGTTAPQDHFLDMIIRDFKSPPAAQRGMLGNYNRDRWAVRLNRSLADLATYIRFSDRSGNPMDRFRDREAVVAALANLQTLCRRYFDGSDQNARTGDPGLHVGQRFVTSDDDESVRLRGGPQAMALLDAERWLASAIGKHPQGKQLLAAVRKDAYDEPRWNVAFDMAEDLGQDASQWRQKVAQAFESLWG